MDGAEKRVFKDIFNYWKTLKGMGITEKQLIIKMNTFGNYPLTAGKV